MPLSRLVFRDAPCFFMEVILLFCPMWLWLLFQSFNDRFVEIDWAVILSFDIGYEAVISLCSVKMRWIVYLRILFHYYLRLFFVYCLVMLIGYCQVINTSILSKWLRVKDTEMGRTYPPSEPIYFSLIQFGWFL